MKKIRFAIAAVLLCALSVLSACGGQAKPSQPVGETTPAPSGVVVIQPTPTPSAQPTPTPTPYLPVNTGDIPAIQPDEVTTLTYTVEGEERTVKALRHYSLHGYSIIYDTQNYVCQPFVEGDSYWAATGNYLSVSVVMGMPMEDVLAGLMLQIGIEEGPEQGSVGAEHYPAQTLSITDSNGIYRQFWAVEHSGDVLLIEQSYHLGDAKAKLYRASQLAMLESLLLTQ